MKKLLVALLIGVSLCTLVGCEQAPTTVTEEPVEKTTKVEINIDEAVDKLELIHQYAEEDKECRIATEGYLHFTEQETSLTSYQNTYLLEAEELKSMDDYNLERMVKLINEAYENATNDKVALIIGLDGINVITEIVTKEEAETRIENAKKRAEESSDQTPKEETVPKEKIVNTNNYSINDYEYILANLKLANTKVNTVAYYMPGELITIESARYGVIEGTTTDLLNNSINDIANDLHMLTDGLTNGMNINQTFGGNVQLYLYELMDFQGNYECSLNEDQLVWVQNEAKRLDSLYNELFGAVTADQLAK